MNLEGISQSCKVGFRLAYKGNKLVVLLYVKALLLGHLMKLAQKLAVPGINIVVFLKSCFNKNIA